MRAPRPDKPEEEANQNDEGQRQTALGCQLHEDVVSLRVSSNVRRVCDTHGQFEAFPGEMADTSAEQRVGNDGAESHPSKPQPLRRRLLGIAIRNTLLGGQQADALERTRQRERSDHCRA